MYFNIGLLFVASSFSRFPHMVSGVADLVSGFDFPFAFTLELDFFFLLEAGFDFGFAFGVGLDDDRFSNILSRRILIAAYVS